MLLGSHVSIAGSIYESIDRAVSLGCNTMQIFSRNPRGWQVTGLSSSDVEEFKKRRKEKGISPVIVHIPYIINLASGDDKLYNKSISAYIEDIERAGLLGAEYFCTHLGSHGGRGDDWGIKRFTDGLNEVLKNSPQDVTILLENTAGSGSSLGYKFEHLGKIINGVKKNDKLGVCLDTCHTFTAGYDFRTEKGLKNLLKEFDSIVGLNRLKLVHLNDSKAKLGSKIDRHEHIGKGEIGLDALKRFINHPELKDLPYILETPKKTPKDDPMNIAVVKKMAKG
ncbi:MAG: deoxyribonuclease IV [Candidatus Omnitrophica bacterium]|nr:deoxyribonuclease IV [Candidatus Omnitrophota bacterium]